uniref:Uncharacterized protein PFB0145c-like n=1 Tax=Dermatophagoides pteronyssinus TaxID=6956 RepID=A0A6P6XZM3_DERPT|nr:uncharacterized protein PFB0145c-like [Dermatophagoides pteronyssinus]
MDDKIEQPENGNKYEFNTISDKKDFGSLGIPNYIIEYDPLNLVIKCPRYHRFMTKENSEINIDDLDQIQLEMETLLLDTMKRLRLLKNELNANEIKMLKNNIDASSSSSSSSKSKIEIKQPYAVKEKTFEKYFDRITFKNKANGTMPTNYEIIERFIGTPYPQLNDVDIPNQFWSFVHYFHDISPTEEEVKQCAAFYDACESLNDDLSLITGSNLTINEKNDDTNNDNKSDENLTEYLEKFIHNFSNDETSTENSHGPFTKRLMTSFIKIDENEPIEKNEKLLDEETIKTKENSETGDNKEKQPSKMSKNPIQIEPHRSQKFERSLRKVLKQMNLLHSQPKDTNNKKFEKIRQSLLKSHRLAELKTNYKYAFNDLIHDRMEKKLLSTFNKMFHTYKSIRSSRLNTLTKNSQNNINVDDYRQFDQLWQTRVRLLKYLNLYNRI